MSEPGLACCTPLTGTPMSAAQAEQVAPLLKALADPVRLRLVSLIAASAGGEACVCDLNDAFDLTQATISHHLKVLHSAGVLDRDKRGVWVYYAVRPAALAVRGHPVRHRRARPPREPHRPAGARRVPGFGGPGHGRHRLGHRRAAALPGRRRAPAAGERPRHRRGAGRADPRLRAGVRRPLQPGGHAGRPVLRRGEQPAGRGLPAGAARRRGRRRRRGEPDVRPARGVDLHERPLGRRPVAVGGRRDVRPGRADLRAGPRRPGRAGAVRRRRVHHRGVLVVVVDELRQPDGRRRPHPVGHLRGHRAVVGADVPARAVRRWRGRRRRRGRALSDRSVRRRCRRRPARGVLREPTTAQRAVRLRAQRRPLADGRRLAAPPRRATPSRCARPARSRATRSTRRRSRPWPRWASTSPTSGRRCSPPTRSRPPTWSSRWAAATPARSSPASATSTGTLEDPAGKGVESVRPIRDEIESRVRGLLAELQVPTA